jgi:uncharacterized protein YceK
MSQMKFVAVAAIVVLSGCASITGSEMQALSITATDSTGKTVDQAECSLDNDKGHWTAKTPSFVTVHRSAEDLVVVCKKEGLVDGVLKAISRAAGSMFGNIVFGGGIGAIIDHNKGNGYNYADELPVKMGASSVVDRRDQDNAARQRSAGTTQQESLVSNCGNGTKC